MEEILLVDKETGMTSYDVIRKVKYRYPKGTKIGHTGTLDPFASGLLILLMGRATKKQSEIQGLKKTYIVTAHFNNESDTGDIDGRIINSDNTILNREEIENEIAKNFLGRIMQIPPKYSAKHVNGQRAYDLARNGVEFELKPNPVEIYDFRIIDFNFPFVSFEITCGSGTYIRSLISDLAHNLGTFAMCSNLRRVCIGEYNVNDAYKLSELVDER